MAEKKETKKKMEKTKKESGIGNRESVSCADRLCPWHGDRKLKMRGRTFQGDVVKVLPGRVTIELTRMIRLPKYERFEKRKTKIHARLSDCMKDEVAVGDRIEIAETRAISKTIHFVVSKVVRKKESKNGN